MLSVGHRPQVGLCLWPLHRNFVGHFYFLPGKMRRVWLLLEKTVQRRQEILSANITGLISAKRISSGDLEQKTLLLFTVVTYPASQNQDNHRSGLQTLQCIISSADDQDILCLSPVSLYVFPAIPASKTAFPVSVVYSILRMGHLHRSTSTLP